MPPVDAQEATAAPIVTLPEDEFSRMVAGALKAHGIEAHIDDQLKHINPGNGRSGVIVNPGGAPVRLNVPSAQDLGLLCLQAIRIALQTSRITLVALNDLDTRFRQRQAAQQASTSSGDLYRADTPGKPAPGTTGMGPAETRGAKTTTGA